ncbi:MAG: single-stranded-DNA-specific exonuclease RecJ [Proteobacteria bacterium]|nr:single-stranded-DNA-specific exonuclease RecJ [Pseudomonadota bacterium]MDA1133983.1 single-stranded-DNA-specific exonuclease RecJ [Pseudomonadota bacterium]
MSSLVTTKLRKKNIILEKQLIEFDIHKTLASILSARAIDSSNDIDYKLEKLIPYCELSFAESAANFILDMILAKKNILIIGDYDADGATASACAIKGLEKFGANVDFLVPNRFEDGYGLSVSIVEKALEKKPDLIITVDNGIASIEGVEKAKAHGVDVVITDHHLPGDALPNANFIINPNQKACNFPSKNLCGVGVIFYLLIAIKSQAKKRKLFNKNEEPRLSDLLDIVCLGTIADLVKLDFNNRLLVQFGMHIIRSGEGNFGIRAISQLSNRRLQNLKTSDLSFVIAPKLNAAGRLDDMSLGIKCLLAKTFDEALHHARRLLSLNTERRQIENEMKDSALSKDILGSLENKKAIALYDASWHQGIIGILASRIKEKFYRPTIIFAKDEEGRLKGSGRSISNFHLRDAIDLVSKKNPNLIMSFGGHAMAAGLTILENDFSLFETEFESVASDLLNANDLSIEFEIDHSILDDINIDGINLINGEIWGQGFPAPIFKDSFQVLDQKIIGGKHVKCTLKYKEKKFSAIYFNHEQSLADKIETIYEIDINRFSGKEEIQLILRQIINE